MSKVPVSAGQAAMAIAIAGTLVVSAGISLRLVEAVPPARAADTHAMTGRDGARSGLQPAAAAANQVVIHDFSFGPKALTVAAGAKVIWVNRDDDPHTITSDAAPRLLNSPPLDTGESFAFVFDKPGTYRYFCSIHPHMQGTIVVQ